MRNAVFIAVLLTISPALHAQPSVEERLARLEQEVQTLRAENDALRKQVAAIASPPAPSPAEPPVSVGGVEPQLNLGGYMQLQGETGGRPDTRFNDANDRFLLRRMRVYTTGQFSEPFSFRVEVDASGSLANASAMRLQLVDGYVEWARTPALALRVGQFKTPFGFEQLTSDPVIPVVERTLGNDRITPGRQVGLQAAGSLFGTRVNWAAGAFNGTGLNTNFNDNEHFMLGGRLSGVLLSNPRLTVGIDGFRSRDDALALPSDLGITTFTGRRTGLGADAQLNLRAVELSTELLRERFAGSVDASSWMAQAVVPFASKWQGVIRYDTFEGRDTTHAWLAGANYLIRGNDLKLQLQALRSEGKSRLFARFQTVF